MKTKTRTLKITHSALCLALCIVLPYITGNIPEIGNALSPMHIPVLLCGFICGPFHGALVGFIAPLLRSVITGGYPPIYPTGLAMSFELLTYGLMTGILYEKLPQKNGFVYVALIASMLCGRVVWGAARFIMATVSTQVFTFETFVLGAFLNAISGIILHIVLVPVLVFAVKKAGFMPSKATNKEKAEGV